MRTGTVRWFNVEKGYGFIEPDEGERDIFVPIAVVRRAGLPNLAEGQKLKFGLLAEHGKIMVSALEPDYHAEALCL